MEKANGNTIGETKILMLTSKCRPVICKNNFIQCSNHNNIIITSNCNWNKEDNDNDDDDDDLHNVVS